MGCEDTYARGSGEGLAGPVLRIEEVDADLIDTPTITSSTGTINFANVRVTGLPSQGIDSVGINVLEDRAQLLFGTAPYPPSICLDLPRALVTADLSDMGGTLSVPYAYVGSLQSQQVSASTVNTTTIDTSHITTQGTNIYCDFMADATNLPSIALLNCPLKLGRNSDASTGGFSIGQLLIDAGISAGESALMYLGKSAGSWLLSAGSDALSLMSGYAALSETGFSLGADAAGTGAALGGDLLAFESGAEGMILASTASDAASMFSSAGVLSAEGLAFSTEFGEAGQSLLAGLESSTAEFEEVIQTPSLTQTLLGANRWMAL